MTREEWQQVWKVYQSACSLAPDRRTSLIESSLPAAEMREKALELLRDLDSTGPVEPDSPRFAPPTSEWQFAGQSLGRFECLTPIGRGGMGEVYSAFDPDLGRNVAIKCIAPSRLGTASVVTAFIREARSASILNHPGIVTVYEVIRMQDTVAIVMERVDGDSLRALSGAAQPREMVAAWGQRIAEALAASHTGGIVHRDIKPENLILRADGYVKILDFGLAINRLAAAESLPMGTLRYMSPEQSRAAEVTSATDVFSLGIVLYELATGVHPFARDAGADSTITIVQAVARHEVRPPSTVVRGLRGPFDRLILQMLSKDPAKRPTAQEVAIRLAAIRQAPRRLGRYALAAGLAALGIAIAAWWNAGKGTAPLRPAHILPFTTYEGSETEPRFSPDGSRVVFVWTGVDGTNKDIYVKSAGEDQPRRITTDPAEDFSPRFSPDGSRIAFLRRISGSAEPQVIVVPVAGGAEQVVGRVAPTSGYRGLAWWPDGKSLLVRDVVAGRGTLVRLFVDDGRKVPFTTPPEGKSDAMPEFSPDGSRVAFLRHTSANSTLNLAGAAGGPVRSIVQGIIAGMAWEPDGKALLYADTRGLWRVRVDGATPSTPRVIAEGAFRDIAIDRAGQRLAFSRILTDANIWRIGRDGKGAARFIASSGEDSEPDWSPDGKHVVMRSNRSGAYELYTYNADGSGERQITRFGTHLGSARWSPDGQWIVFDGNRAPVDPSITHHNVFLVPSAGGPFRRLTDDRHHYTVPNWSRDGKWIYCQADSETWKLPAAGGPPLLVDSGSLFDIAESPDRRYLYYTLAGKSGVWRRPIDGGTGTPVAGTERLHFFRYWALSGNDLFFVGGPPQTALRSLNLKTGRAAGIAEIPSKLFSGPRGIAVSPDGSTILYTLEDLTLSDIMLLDNLRQLW